MNMAYKTGYPIDFDMIEKIINSVNAEADYVDIRINESSNNIIVMKDSKVQEVRSGNDLGGSVRILKNGAWGFSFTNQLSKLEDAAQSALKLAKVMLNWLMCKLQMIKLKLKLN